MKQYTHLTHEQKYQILGLQKIGVFYSEIVPIIGVSKSTINREIKGNRGKQEYRSKKAYKLSMEYEANKV